MTWPQRIASGRKRNRPGMTEAKLKRGIELSGDAMRRLIADARGQPAAKLSLAMQMVEMPLETFSGEQTALVGFSGEVRTDQGPGFVHEKHSLQG